MSINFIGNKCIGCRACEQICPKRCIEFLENEEGFNYPVINEKICINCNKCNRVCPVLNKPDLGKIKEVYAGWTRNDKLIKKSSSGGIFAVLAQKILEEKGKVCGCAYDSKLYPMHILIDKENEIFKLQGSKYVESDINNIYSKIKEKLNLGEKILFSGTPCQCAGLKNYLGKEYQNLFIVDIICHGVPSRKLFRSYIEYLEEKFKGKILSFDFRNKEKHGWSLTYKYILKKREKIKKYQGIASLSSYYHGFLLGLTYRESCYQCSFANPNRVSDITLGDFWGVENISPENSNYMGVSAIIVNTSKGKNFFNLIKNEINYKNISFEMVTFQNSNLLYPTLKNEIRNVIYDDFNKYGYKYIAKKYLKTPHYFLEIIKSLIPNYIRQTIKKIIKKIIRK